MIIDKEKVSPSGYLSVCHEAIPIVTAAEVLQKPLDRRSVDANSRHHLVPPDFLR